MIVTLFDLKQRWFLSNCIVLHNFRKELHYSHIRPSNLGSFNPLKIDETLFYIYFYQAYF